MAKQRQHSAQFKYEVVIAALRGDKTRAELCREHKLTKSLLWKWEQAFVAGGPAIFESDQSQRRAIAERDERIADLERLVGRLTMENEILKKSETWLTSQRRKSAR